MLNIGKYHKSRSVLFFWLLSKCLYILAVLEVNEMQTIGSDLKSSLCGKKKKCDTPVGELILKESVLVLYQNDGSK